MDRCICFLGWRGWGLALGLGIAGVMSSAPAQAQQLCGGVDYPFPYTDVSGVGAPFCPGIMEGYVTGVTKGTSPTTFSPTATVTRVQMTTFLQRSLDQGLARTSRRAALNQWWIPQTLAIQTITLFSAIPANPKFCAADGENIWVSAAGANQVAQVQASTGKRLGLWTGATNSNGVVVAAGKVYVAGATAPGSLYVIDPTQSAGPVTVAASNLGTGTNGIAFDGANLWTTNIDSPAGSVSIINPQTFSVTTITTGFSGAFGILYDGAHIWVTDSSAGTLLKLDAAGAILQTVAVGTNPSRPAFDGANIWVPNQGDNSVTVVQASTGNVVAVITADATNLLNVPKFATFDGERILFTNQLNNSVTMFKAADLSFIANVSTGASTQPFGACSDGINFWVTDVGLGNLLRL